MKAVPLRRRGRFFAFVGLLFGVFVYETGVYWKERLVGVAGGELVGEDLWIAGGEEKPEGRWLDGDADGEEATIRTGGCVLGGDLKAAEAFDGEVKEAAEGQRVIDLDAVDDCPEGFRDHVQLIASEGFLGLQWGLLRESILRCGTE